MVCFSQKKRSRIESCAKIKKPVKIKKFRLEMKSNSEDIVIDESSEIEECPDIDFTRKQLPTNFSITQLKTVCVGQLVTVKAKVATLQEIKEVNNGTLKFTEAILIDPTDSIKITIWEDHIGSIEQDKTYNFQNIRVKKNTLTNEVYVNTAKGDTTTISVTNDFQQQLALPLSDYSNITVQGEIWTVNRVNMYHSCFKCHKKVQLSNQKYLECNNCKIAQKPKACKKEWVIALTFLYNNTKVDVTMFTNIVLLILKQTHISEATLTCPDDLKSIIFNLSDDIQITFNKTTKVVSNILIN